MSKYGKHDFMKRNPVKIDHVKRIYMLVSCIKYNYLDRNEHK